MINSFKKIQHLISSRYLAGGFVIASLAFISCDETLVYSEYKKISEAGWGMRDTLEFQIDSMAEAGAYALDLGVRTTSDKSYGFKALQVQVEQVWLSPALQDSIDTLQCADVLKSSNRTMDCQMINDRGDNLGEGISNYQYSFPLDTLTLPVGASGKLRVAHRMRRPQLQGIVNVGIELRRVEE
ncbi:MAG: gliding motility lipoprotein GldH [Bacteroidaceae bacterium]|nr:gliding motility lipoprotein GldH [Bacteroidaceae bacterium]